MYIPQQCYVHTVTTITLTVMKIIKHAADKIVTDGYTWMYWQFIYNMIVFLNTHMRFSKIVMALENILLHIQFEIVISRKFSFPCK